MSAQPERPRACVYCSARGHDARDGHVCIIDVLQVAVDGGQAIVAGTSWVGHVFDDLVQLLRSHEGAVTEIDRRNGCESITLLSGGRVRFRRGLDGLRSLTADVVFIAGNPDGISQELAYAAGNAVRASHVRNSVRWLAW